MEFVSVNFSLNQIYQIEKSVFETMTKKAIKKVKGITYVSSTVELSKKNDDVSIDIEIEKDSAMTYDVAFSKIIDQIELHIFNLLDGKPKNIKIRLKK